MSECVFVHVRMRKDLYEKIWDLVRKRYVVPTKKFHIVLNEVIEKGLEVMQE